MASIDDLRTLLSEEMGKFRTEFSGRLDTIGANMPVPTDGIDEKNSTKNFGLWKVKTGRPERFKGIRSEYKTWIHGLTTWAKRVFPKAREYVKWAVEQADESL